MQIPVRITCPQCSRSLLAEHDTVNGYLKVKCPDCNLDETASYIQGFHIGHALLEYASNALGSENTNFTILFTGMAIDCYLSHLYFKWRDIEELQKATIPYDPIRVEETITQELLNIRDFLDKTKAVAKILYPAGVVKFIKSHHDLQSEISTGFPSININAFTRCVRDQVMWKRNNIIHIGKVKFDKLQATKALNYSRIFVKVFETMDEEKSQA